MHGSAAAGVDPVLWCAREGRRPSGTRAGRSRRDRTGAAQLFQRRHTQNDRRDIRSDGTPGSAGVLPAAAASEDGGAGGATERPRLGVAGRVRGPSQGSESESGGRGRRPRAGAGARGPSPGAGGRGPGPGARGRGPGSEVRGPGPRCEVRIRASGAEARVRGPSPRTERRAVTRSGSRGVVPLRFSFSLFPSPFLPPLPFYLLSSLFRLLLADNAP